MLELRLGLGLKLGLGLGVRLIILGSDFNWDGGVVCKIGVLGWVTMYIECESIVVFGCVTMDALCLGGCWDGLGVRLRVRD